MGKIKKYVHLEWIHNNNEYPTHIYSAIGEDDYEVQKVETYKSDKIGFAIDEIEFNGTGLSEKPFPSLEELIGIDEWGEEVKAYEITAEEFDAIWRLKVEPLLG